MSARLMMIRHWHLRNGHKPRDGHDYCEGCAHEMDDLLKHMDAAGFAVVPVEPTREMLNAAIDTDRYKLGDISPLGFRCSPQQMFNKAYDAMLKAAQEDSRE